MKKLALLLSMVLLAACGGSGGSSTVNGTTPTGNAATGGNGTLTISINDSQSAKLFYNISTPATKDLVRRRVVITNPSLNDPTNGMVFKAHYDYSKGDTPPTLAFNLPYANGYLIEFVEYYATPSGFTTYSTAASTATGGGVYSTTVTTPTTNIIKYARVANVNIPGTTSITLTPKPVTMPTMQFPLTALKFESYSGIPAKSESQYFNVRRTFANFTAAAKPTFSTPAMFNDSWYLRVRLGPATGRTTANTSDYFKSTISGSDVSVSSITTYINNAYAMRALATYYLSSSILLPTEAYDKFYIYDNTTTFQPVVVRLTSTTLPNP